MQRPTAWELALLALIVAVGIGVRFYGLQSRGLILFDAAYYANAAKAPVYALDWFRDRSEPKRSLAEFLKERGVIGFPLKPGHVLLIAGGFLLVGVHDFVVLGVSALASVLTIVVIYLIGCRFFDPLTAMTAAALFAVSGNSVAFARTGYPQADTVLILAVATYLYLRTVEDNMACSRWLIGASLISGFGLLMHQSIVLAIATFLLTDLFRFLIARQLAWSTWRTRTLWFVACFATPYALLEVAYRLAGRSLLWLSMDYARGVLRVTGEPWELIEIQLTRAGGWPGVLAENAVFLGRMFGTLETPVFWVSAVLGFAILSYRAVRARSIPCLVLACQILFPLMYSIAVYATLKAVQVSLPAVVLGGGLVASMGLRSLRVRSLVRREATLATLLVCGTLALGALWVRPWVTYQTGYQEMARQLIAYMSREGGTLSIPDQGNLAPLLAFYLGETVKSLPADFKGRIEFMRPGGDYAVVDYQRLIKGDPVSVKRLVERQRAVIKVMNAPAMLPVYHLHRAVPSAIFDNYRAVLACAPCPDMANIIVYDLRKLADR